MKKNECAIVIPIYSNNLKKNELISLEQAKNIFSGYELIAVSPNDLDMDEENFTQIERFNSNFFLSVDAYNTLMLSCEFYRRFEKYEYILIYQLDAFVFSDQMQYFCKLGYDYIGAPWLHGIFNYVDSSHYLWNVGNGGLSLRKVPSFIRILEERKPLLGDQIKNEDLYYSSIVDEKFRIAPIDIALQFAFERQVKKCFELNKRQLPFGCHAWERYNLNFWKLYIEQFGYKVDETLKTGNEDTIRSKEYLLWEGFSQSVFDEQEMQKVNEKIKVLFEKANNSCIIFGAGFYGNSFSRWFSDIGIYVMFFCDNNMFLEGKSLNGIKIIGADKLLKKKGNSLVVILNYQYENDIAEQLKSIGLKPEKDFITLTDLIKKLE